MIGIRVLSSLLLVSSIIFSIAHGDEPADDLSKKPVTTDTTPIGKLLKKWYTEGTAAGNVGDWYDNRDGEHSPLDIRIWPQLQKVKYTEEDFKLKRNWAAQRIVLPNVTFGNSSTSAGPTTGGSNPRMYYLSSMGMKLLEAHYRRNNLYIYPEHRDHDPGRNGVGPNNEEGWGDMYPTNTPYLIISQGSSGTDQPFMRAVPFTLAAFRPEVKKKLIEKGLLMPTVQRILRATNRSLKKVEDYFTGQAHPSVFEGRHVDALAMVEMAHAMTVETIPPLAAIKVLEEDAPINGKDFFDLPGRTEKLADTAHVIARVWRGVSDKRRVVLSAADSEDVNAKPLSFRWVVLRGEEKRIQIKPRGPGNVEAEITISYHARRPITPDSSMESNRIDIGVFADNGREVSTPAFFTYLSLDDEERTPNRIIYGAATTEVKILDWPKTFSALSAMSEGAQKETLDQVATNLARAQELLVQAKTARIEPEKKRNAAGASRAAAAKKLKDNPDDATAIAEAAQAQVEQMKADKEYKQADDRVKVAQKGFDDELDTKRDALSDSPRLYSRKQIDPVKAAMMPKDAVQIITRPNYVDPRLAVTRRWIDEYDKEGGWTRREGGKTTRFTAEGWLVTREDDKGRPIQASTVIYLQDPPTGKMIFNTNPLKWNLGEEEITISYEDDKRIVNKRKKVEKESGQ